MTEQCQCKPMGGTNTMRASQTAWSCENEKEEGKTSRFVRYNPNRKQQQKQQVCVSDADCVDCNETTRPNQSAESATSLVPTPAMSKSQHSTVERRSLTKACFSSVHRVWYRWSNCSFSIQLWIYFWCLLFVWFSCMEIELFMLVWWHFVCYKVIFIRKHIDVWSTTLEVFNLVLIKYWTVCIRIYRFNRMNWTDTAGFSVPVEVLLKLEYTGNELI